MKIIVIISLLLSSLVAQDYTKKEFIDKSIEKGYNFETCAFGSSRKHFDGTFSAKQLSIQRAVTNIATNNCKKIKISRNKNGIIEEQKSSAQFGYKIILQGMINKVYVSTVCARDKIICTNK